MSIQNPLSIYLPAGITATIVIAIILWQRWAIWENDKIRQLKGEKSLLIQWILVGFGGGGICILLLLSGWLESTTSIQSSALTQREASLTFVRLLLWATTGGMIALSAGLWFIQWNWLRRKTPSEYSYIHQLESNYHNNFGEFILNEKLRVQLKLIEEDIPKPLEVAKEGSTRKANQIAGLDGDPTASEHNVLESLKILSQCWEEYHFRLVVASKWESKRIWQKKERQVYNRDPEIEQRLVTTLERFKYEVMTDHKGNILSLAKFHEERKPEE